MSFIGLLRVWSDFYSGQDPSHDGVHSVALLRFSSECVVGEAHRGDVLGARKLARRVREVAHVGRHEVPYTRLARERQAGGPVVPDHLRGQLGQQASTAAEVDAGRQALTARKLLDAQRESLQQHLCVRAEQLRDLAVLIRREQSLGVAHLARLCFFVAQAEREREAAREGATAEVKHPCALHAAVAYERDVGRAAPDVDEDSTLGPYLLVGARASQRVWLRHSGGKLEVELANDGLDGVDVRHRRESVEDGHLEVFAREPNRVRHRVSVDPHIRDRRVHESRLELAVAALHLQQVLRLAKRAALDHLEHGRHLAAPDPGLGVLARIRDGRRETFDQLACDADHDLTGNGLGHVLRRLERSVARVDNRLEVGNRATGHGGRRLRLPAHSEHLAVGTFAPDDEHLDQVGADVEHGEVAVVVAALPEELEFRHFRASARRWKACSAGTVRVPVTRWAGPPPLPKSSLRRLASYWLVRSLDTLMTNLSLATTVTIPERTFSR